jgi:cell division protein FtsL
MTTHIVRRQLATAVSFSTVRTLILLLALLALLGMVYMVQSTQATVTGQRVQELREQLVRLDREIDQLEYDIAVQTSPPKIAERARALGLHPPTLAQTTFVQVKNYPVAMPAAAPSTSSSTLTSNDSFIVTLWQQLLARLGIPLDVPSVQASP